MSIINLEKTVTDHGKQLNKHDERLNHIENDVADLKKDLRAGLDRVDQSNQYLREQNNQILKEIIYRNNTAEQHDYDIKKLTKGNQLKMFGMIFGASGLAAIVLDLLFKLFRP